MKHTYPRILVLITLLAVSSFAAAAQSTDQPTATDGAARRLWTCGMHPQVIQDHPGTCPICGMELTPLPSTVSANSAAGTVTIDPVVVQNMGVRTVAVRRGRMQRTLRVAGVLAEAEPNRHDVNLRVSGWIEKLYADTEGMHVEAGDPLFDLFSPELRVAIDELRATRGVPPAGSPLAGSARAKARRLGLSEAQIRRFAEAAVSPDVVTFTSPVSGHIVDKPVVTGSAVAAGTTVLRIVDHSTLWLELRIFEHQLDAVQIGSEVRARVAALPETQMRGVVSFLHPHIDERTRTATARVAIANPTMQLRPGMYATAEIASSANDSVLLAPRSAVIDSGTRQIVFVARGEGRFDPRTVSVGAASDGDDVEIREGVGEGDEVVVSGQFLLDSESRLQEAIRKFREIGPAPGAAR